MMRLIKTLFVLFGLLSYPLTVLAQNMFKTVADTPVYAQILGKNRQVAMLSDGFFFSAAEGNSIAAEAVTIQVGNETASVKKDSVRQEDGAKSAVEKNQDLSGYIITTKPTALYD